MNRKRMLAGFGLVAALALFAGVGQAELAILEFSGFVHESDNSPGAQGFPPSDVGDILSGVGFIESVDPQLDWEPSEYQITWYITDLVSNGEMDLGGGLISILYSGGSLYLYADRYNDGGFTQPDFGVEPPNATSPGTFTDGELFLEGAFTNFQMVYHGPLHSGSFEGHLNWTGGSQLDELYPDPEGYTIAGTVDPQAAPVPDGYDLESVGQISFDPALPTENGTWGRVKVLYSR